MTRFALLGLTLLFAICAGFSAEILTFDLFHHALRLSDGKPMPPLTKWIYWHFASWRNGSVFWIFLIPWALLLCSVACASPARRASGGCPQCIFLSRVALFGFAEIILCLVFGHACLLPFVPTYRIVRESDAGLIARYLPLLLVSVIIAAAAVVPLIRYIRRSTSSNDIAA